MCWYLSRTCSYNSQACFKNEKDKCQMPDLITKEQKLARVRILKQFLKQFPKYNNRSFANIITGDETWVHFYEPKRKIKNKIWATKGGKRLCIAKRTMSIKKVMYVIFFSNQGPAIQIAVPKGKSVNARFYKGNVLHKLKKYFLSCRPATGLRGVRLLHDNASSHKAAIVREYLNQEKVVELPHPPCSRAANRKSQNLLPFVKKQKNMEVFQFTKNWYKQEQYVLFFICVTKKKSCLQQKLHLISLYVFNLSISCNSELSICMFISINFLFQCFQKYIFLPHPLVQLNFTKSYLK